MQAAHIRPDTVISTHVDYPRDLNRETGKRRTARSRDAVNNIVEAAESQHRAIISAQFGVILLFVQACSFSAYTRLTGPLFRGGSGRGMTMNCSRFFGIHRTGAIVALLIALFAVCITPTTVWAVATVIPETGRLHVADLDLVVAASPMRLEVRRTLLARPDQYGLLGERWRLNWEQDLLRIGGLALLTDTLGVDTFAPAKGNDVLLNHRGEQLHFNDNGAATLTRADGTVERYDAYGRLVERADRNNNRIVLRYNEAGILEHIQGPHKAELHFKTDEVGHPTPPNAAGFCVETKIFGGRNDSR